MISELAGLGWHDDVDIAFSARHGYLAGIAIAALVAFVVTLRATPAATRRTRVAQIVEDLPFRGRGAGFIVLSFGLQFGFFAITQIGEGCPLCRGDVFAGAVAAAIAALLGTLLVNLGKRRVLEIAIALVWFVAKSVDPQRLVRALRNRERVRLPVSRRVLYAFSCRPPPLVRT